jgi:NADPH2 dehydrogenase
MSSTLFSEYTMRGLTLPNRIVVSPMCQYSAAPDGSATDWHLMHLGHLAICGAALVITEATAVDPSGRISGHDLGLSSDANEAALEPVIRFCRERGGAKLGMQLAHAGRKGSCTVAWERQRSLSPEEGGWTIYGPSPLAYPGRDTPEALSAAGIARTVRAFAAAAERAHRLGFDLLELHGAHGYLIHNFLSPLTNARTDNYGGALDGRLRFAIEVFDAVRAVWPERKPLGMRISASDWVPGGWSLDDSIVLATRLRERGCDFITASSGGAVPEQKVPVHPGYQIPFAERIRREAGVPTIGIGLITEARQAEAILAENRADLVALARGMLYDPRWPWHAALELGEEIFYPPQYARAHPSLRAGLFPKPARDA